MARAARLGIAVVAMGFGVAPASAGLVLQQAGLDAGNGAVFAQLGVAVPIAGQTTWTAAVDVALLASLPQSLDLNLPDRASAALTRLRSETRGPGRFLWTGSGNGCTAVFNVAPENTLGVISCLTGNYALQGAGASLRLSKFVQTNTAARESTSPLPQLAPYRAPAAAAMTGANLDTTVDVLVLYTEAVRQTLDPSGGTALTRQFAQTAIDTVQTAMDNSTTPGQPVIANVRLAGVSGVARTASGDLTADVDYLDREPEPQKLRDFWAADVVIYLTVAGEPYRFGRANIPGLSEPAPGPDFASRANGAVVLRCALSSLGADCPDTYVFLHEFAHLFGANHNPESPRNPTPLEPWAFAHWAQNHVDGGGAHTLVSYYIGQCAPAASQCPIVLYYSNSKVYDDWFQTGIRDQRENSRVIAEFAQTTAQYRKSIGRIFYDGFQ